VGGVELRPHTVQVQPTSIARGRGTCKTMSTNSRGWLYTGNVRTKQGHTAQSGSIPTLTPPRPTFQHCRVLRVHVRPLPPILQLDKVMQDIIVLSNDGVPGDPWFKVKDHTRALVDKWHAAWNMGEPGTGEGGKWGCWWGGHKCPGGKRG
jgi:hypothetical protein